MIELFLFALVVILGSLKSVQYLRWLRSPFVKTINQIPGPGMLPILGSIPSIPRNTDELLQLMQNKLVQKYGSIFQIWIWSHPYVLISSPTSIETVLTSKTLIQKSDSYDNIFLPWLGAGLLMIADREKWKMNRRLLTPAFHFQILENFFDVFNKNGDIFRDQLAKGITDKPDEEVDVFPMCKKCTMDVICETAMGIEVNAQTTDSEYLHAIQKLSEISMTKGLSPWKLFPDWMYRLLSSEGKEYYRWLDFVHSFVAKVIEERKRDRHLLDDDKGESIMGLKKRRAFLDLMLIEAQKGANLTDLDIHDEVTTFMFGGQDTTAGALVWFLYCMGTNPTHQELVHQELDDIFEDSDRPCSMEDASNMKYLECCLKESSRLYPSVPAVERRVTEEIMLDGFKVPVGATIGVLIYALHHSEEIFPDPMAYKPERFLPDQSAGRHPFAFIPFSAGTRNCIGQRFAFLELKVILSSLLRRFRFTYDTEKHGPSIPSPELILKPKHGMPLKITQRLPSK